LKNILKKTLLFSAQLAAFAAISCNNPFQPEVAYTPKLNIYSVLFANSPAVYLRLMPVTKSPADIALPVHGASVTIEGTGLNGPAILKDTTAAVGSDSTSYYYAPVKILPGGSYSISVTQPGYPEADAHVDVPLSYAAFPDQTTYDGLQNPKHLHQEIQLTVNVSELASAAFVQVLVECRGIDQTGKLSTAYFSAFPVDSLNPFTELSSTNFPITVDTNDYKAAFNLADQFSQNLRPYHLYVDVIATQIDDNLYRYFITSHHSDTQLLMRTDKLIFSNIFNSAGTGIISGACVDTTRIFLY
jgi:hypothetical protein